MSSDRPAPQRTVSRSLRRVLIALIVAITAYAVALYTPARRLLAQCPVVSLTGSSTRRTMATTTAHPSLTNSQSPAPLFTIKKRSWDARGHADHGWLYTFHTFSFASYYDPNFQSFGPLRVINEDRVERGTGFGTHAHAEFLIWSYIVSGELEHKDSMGNLEKLRRGEVQFTSAGTGIRHSEYCRNQQEDVHFLQIWAKPDTKGLNPSYKTSKFSDEEKRDKLCRIMESDKRLSAEEEGGPISLSADLSMDASILSPGKCVSHRVAAEGQRNIYLHLIMTDKTQPKTGGAQITVGNETLGEGDGAFIKTTPETKTITVKSVGAKPAEFLLFDMGQQ